MNLTFTPQRPNGVSASVRIGDEHIYASMLTGPELAAVLAWASRRRSELRQAWDLVQDGRALASATAESGTSTSPIFAAKTTCSRTRATRTTSLRHGSQRRSGPYGITWLGDSEVRCDHVFAIAGCVFPPYWPTVDISGSPHIAPHILLVEGRGAHLGNAAYLSPLSKGTGRQQTRNNRRQVCHGKPPKKGWSCDEYPFASTAQGGILGSFYKISRLLPRDKFCVTA